MMFRSFGSTLAIAGTALALSIAVPARAAPVTVTIDDAGLCASWSTSGTAANPTYTCNPASTTPAPTGSAPTGCSISPSQTISAGTTIALTLANCTAGGAAISYSWRVNSASGTQVGTTASISETPTATTTYYATATANGTSTTYSTTVNVTSTAPAPPPAGASSCSGYDAVNIGDLKFDGSQTNAPPMAGAKVAYARIVIPNPLPAGYSGAKAGVSVFAYGSDAIYRTAYLSKTACDFSSTAFAAVSEGITTNLYMTFGGSDRYAVSVQPGEVWYLNIRQANISGALTCNTGAPCYFAIRMYPPSN